MSRGSHDRGETLVEVVIAVVILGTSVSAIVSALATVANAGIVQRDGAVADRLLRNVAEAAKADSRTCASGDALDLDLTVPDRWSLAVEPSSPACPEASGPLHLTAVATAPDGRTSSLEFVVRTP